jgi:hypothetical protein
MIWIASVSSANAVFTSIPQTFTHLQVRIYARNPAANLAQNTYVQLNGDAGGSSYSSHSLIGDGSSATSGGFGLATSYAQMPQVAGSSATAGIFGVAIIDILDYTNTNKLKTIRGIGGNDRNGAGTVSMYSSLWNSLSAVNALTAGTVDGNAASGSRVDLYGITISSVTGA